MKLYSLEALPAQPITRFGSGNVNQSPVARWDGDRGQIMRLRIGPGGRIGAHEAACWQLFLVIDGGGWVRGPEPERTMITTGMAVLWERGEMHESGSDTGMVALVIEGEALDPEVMRTADVRG